MEATVRRLSVPLRPSGVEVPRSTHMTPARLSERPALQRTRRCRVFASHGYYAGMLAYLRILSHTPKCPATVKNGIAGAVFAIFPL